MPTMINLLLAGFVGCWVPDTWLGLRGCSLGWVLGMLGGALGLTGVGFKQEGKPPQGSYIYAYTPESSFNAYFLAVNLGVARGSAFLTLCHGVP